MQLTIDVDQKQLLLRMRKGEKRLAYAVVNAVNATSKRVQQAEFQHMRLRFQIRKDRFFFGSSGRPGGVAARIKPFASVKQGRPFSEVFIAQAPSSGSQRRLLLPFFEEGGEKKPSKGADRVAIPISGRARPQWTGPVAKEYTFAGMKLEAHRQGKRVTKETKKGEGFRRVGIGLIKPGGKVVLPKMGRRTQWKGRHRTFMLDRTQKLPQGGIFQRTGPKPDDIRLLWKFQRRVRVDSRLEFVRVGAETAQRWFREEMEKQILDALAHDRGRSF